MEKGFFEMLTGILLSLIIFVGLPGAVFISTNPSDLVIVSSFVSVIGLSIFAGYFAFQWFFRKVVVSPFQKGFVIGALVIFVPVAIVIVFFLALVLYVLFLS